MTQTNRDSTFSNHPISRCPEENNELPHQKFVGDYFIKKRIGKSSDGKKISKLKRILRLGKNRYLNVTQKNPFATAVATIAIMMTGLFLFSQTSEYFSASITDAPSPIPFDGTVYPYEYAPDWFAVGGKNSRSFSSYSSAQLVKAPRYELSKMQNETWARKYVNPKITYSIVYMGKYKFDHKEYTGSHPAVDIKLAPGTPVYSIANGIVVKAKSQTTGYGKHVVIRHDKVPEYGTVYSSYSHFSNISVKVGDTVKRGQQIGNVGSTGNSTTAHIHFQIDKKGAPFYPYWPFSMKDARASGYNFTTAVNAGFGKANALKYTIHPFDFIHKYEKGTTLIASNNSHSSARSEAITPKPKATEIPQRKSGQKLGGFKLIASPTKILEGEKVKISVLSADEKKEFFESFSGNVEIHYELKEGKALNTFDIEKGEGNISFTLDKVGKNKIKVSYGNIVEMIEIQVVKRKTDGNSEVATRNLNETAERESQSDISKSAETLEQNSDKKIEFSHFQFFAENSVKKGDVLEIVVKAIDKNNEIISSENFPKQGSFIITSKNGKTDVVVLRKGDFANGYVKIYFTAQNTGLGFISINGDIHKISITSPIEKQSENANIFTDISPTHKNAKALTYLKQEGIIGGYSDGSFKPDKKVNRGEALKMIFKAMNISIRKNLENPFNDVSKRDWFADYVLSAYDKKIVKGYSDGSFKPEKTVGRAEYFKILINASNLPLEGIPKRNPFADVEKNSWFAEYAEFAKNNRLLDFGTNFLPNEGMTRGEVAESIYRLIK